MYFGNSFASLRKLLTHLATSCKKEVKTIWTLLDWRNGRFSDLKHSIIAHHYLHSFEERAGWRYKLRFTINKLAVHWVRLSQTERRSFRALFPNALRCRAMFDAMHCEFSAIVCAILFLRPYLGWRRFTIRADHDVFKIDCQLRRFDRTTCQEKALLLRAGLWYSTLVGLRNQVGHALSRFDTRGMEKTLIEDAIPKLMFLLVQHIYFHNKEQDGSSVDKYCVCESNDGAVGEKQTADCERQNARRQLDTPPYAIFLISM